MLKDKPSKYFISKRVRYGINVAKIKYYTIRRA